MNKKAIVLFMTLIFIVVISTLIVYHLEQYQNFIQRLSLEHKLTQLKLTHENIKTQISKLLKQNKKNLNEILNILDEPLIFSYGNIDVTLQLQSFVPPPCNLNQIDPNKILSQQCSDDIVSNIEYEYDFMQLLSKYKTNYAKFSSNAQIKFFLDDYILQTQDQKIKNIASLLGFLDASKNYIKLDYTITQENTKSYSTILFDENIKIVDFDLKISQI